MGDMIELFAELQVRAAYQKSFRLLNNRLTIRAQSQQLLDSIQLPPNIWRPVQQQDDAVFVTTCIVDSCTRVAGWLRALPPSPTRFIEDSALGRCRFFVLPDGLLLEQEDRGVLLRSSDGRFICLIKGDPVGGLPHHLPNVGDLFGVIANDILRRANQHLVHAGAVGHGGSGYLFAGTSGAGKTTYTLNLVAKGWDFFGDDMVIVGADDSGRWMVWPFWRAVNITCDTYGLLPALSPLRHETTSWPGKRNFEIETIFKVKRPSPAPIGAIFYLDSHGGCVAERLNPQQALNALGKTFLSSFFPESAIINLDFLMDIVHHVPIWRIGRDTPLSAAIKSIKTQQPLNSDGDAAQKFVV